MARFELGTAIHGPYRGAQQCDSFHTEPLPGAASPRSVRGGDAGGVCRASPGGYAGAKLSGRLLGGAVVVCLTGLAAGLVGAGMRIDWVGDLLDNFGRRRSSPLTAPAGEDDS
jgi:hypothetical protein